MNQHLKLNGSLAGCTYDTDVRLSGPQSDGASFLCNTLFRERNEQRRSAIGFKLLYDQARSAPADSAWTFLEQTDSIRIIHIKRANLLESWLSFRVALLTGCWCQETGLDAALASSPRMFVDPEETRSYFDKTSAYRRWVTHTFRRHQVLEIDYSLDLCSRFNETMESTQYFLDIPFEQLTPSLEKQARASPSSQIINYTELKAYFQHTPYEVFFTR